MNQELKQEDTVADILLFIIAAVLWFINTVFYLEVWWKAIDFRELSFLSLAALLVGGYALCTVANTIALSIVMNWVGIGFGLIAINIIWFTVLYFAVKPIDDARQKRIDDWRRKFYQ